MNVFYDNQVDAIYLQLSAEKPEGVTEMSEGINIDMTSEGKVIGIEILDASKKMDMKTILSYSLEFDENLLLKNAS